jgi:hypothetical protein
MQDGTASSDLAVNPCALARKLPTKTPIFIAGFNDTRTYMAKVRPCCPSELTAHLMADRLIFVVSAADVWRVKFSALRSVEGKD